MKEIKLRAWVYNESQLDEAIENEDIEAVYVPMSLLNEKYTVYAGKLIVLTPEFLGSVEKQTEYELLQLREIGFVDALAHTVGHIELLKKTGFNIHGGVRLNCTNSEGMRFFAECGLCDIIVSQELTVKRINNLDKPIKAGFMAYGKQPLMLNRRCPVMDGRPCGGRKTNCDRKITDRKGNMLEILCSDNSVEILNSDTLVLSDKLSDFDMDFAVLRFTTEKNISDITTVYRNGAVPEHEHFTRGLYYRGVL